MEHNAQSNNNSTIAKLIGASLALLFLLLLIALIVNLVKLGAANDRKDALQAQSAKLDRLIEKNDDMIEYCGSAEFIEEYAREYLDMVYRGETVIGGKNDNEE
ncbi:MAG: septum formation initiator family protein [Clostridiales bacterium]|nr:septum formation initiator family protein [Clostridiales bacterium]